MLVKQGQIQCYISNGGLSKENFGRFGDYQLGGPFPEDKGESGNIFLSIFSREPGKDEKGTGCKEHSFHCPVDVVINSTNYGKIKKSLKCNYCSCINL